MNETESAVHELNKKSVIIERARPDDAEAICDIRDRAWLEAYTNSELGITRDDVLLNAHGPNGEFLPRRIAYLKEQLARTDKSGMGTFVAKVDGKVVGYTDPHVDERGRKRIGAMYVAPEAQGLGIGGKLIEQAIGVLGRNEDIYLEVVSYNDKAIGFYEHYGFERTNAVVPEEEGRPTYLKTLPQIEMMLKAV